MTAAPVELFGALSDGNRQRVLALLGQDGAATSTALAARLDVSRQAVDKLLRVLRGAGLVDSVRCGREVRHDVRQQPLRDAARWLDGLAATWDRRLAAVKAAAEAPTAGS